MRDPLERRIRQATVTRWRSVGCLGLLLAGCSAPAAPIDQDELVQKVQTREASLQQTVQALQLSGLEPLFGRRPTGSEKDLDDPGFWHACAWAYAPGPIAARRDYYSARAARRSAGAPGPIGVGTETLDWGDPGRDTQVRLTFDLLGILGLGRSGAVADLAVATERQALGRLEQAVWSARFDVDRARVSVAASRMRLAILETLSQEVAKATTRIDILDERGWIPSDRAAAARAMTERLHRRQARTETVLAEDLARLSKAAGLPPSSDSLTELTSATLAHYEPLSELPPLPTATALLDRHPLLRARQLDYALAEARIQRAAAEAWPDIRIGPRLRFLPSDTLTGGILDVALPWPGSVQGYVDAAVQERTKAGELLENALVAQLADAKSRRRALREALRTARLQGPAIEAGTGEAWKAAQARFAADPASLPMWTDRLERRIAGVVAAIDAREQVILALLCYQEACGPDREKSP